MTYHEIMQRLDYLEYIAMRYGLTAEQYDEYNTLNRKAIAAELNGC